MVSAFTDTTYTFEKDPALNFEMNDKYQTDGRGRHNTITMWIIQLPEIFIVVKIWCFLATYLEAHSTSMSSNSQWKIIHLLQKSIGSMCQIKIQTTVKMFYVLDICHLLGCINHHINCIDQGQWSLNTTADFRGFPYWFSMTYWLAEWRWKEQLYLNSFIQMIYTVY